MKDVLPIENLLQLLLFWVEFNMPYFKHKIGVVAIFGRAEDALSSNTLLLLLFFQVQLKTSYATQIYMLTPLHKKISFLIFL